MDLTPEELSALRGLYKAVKPQLTVDHSSQKWMRNTNSDVLIVDGYNTFMRCWSANPAMDENGNHTGGIVGFFRSIGHAIKLLHPTRCVITFDGVGGSLKRRKIFPEYKAHRKNKIRLNRVYEDQTTWSEEDRNCLKQLIKLDNYLKFLPINVLRLDNVEADDTIAYCAVDVFNSSRVIVMSSDKDFLQLVNDRIKVWSPTKKLLYGPAEILRDYGIHPTNFVLYRAMDGDDSDNIDGIRGAGLKTVLKCFPFLAEEKKYTLNDIITYATDNRKKYKVYESVIDGKDILERNISLMQLEDSLLSVPAQLLVTEALQPSKIPIMDRNAFVRLVAEDSMINNFPDHQKWLTECFGAMDSVTRIE